MATTPTPPPITPATAADKPAVFLRAMYVKDLSFENPRAPGIIFNLREQPQMEVSVHLGTQRLEEKVYELAIHITARAITDNSTVFLCDLVYAGVLEVQNIPDTALDSTLFVQGAQLVYPFARRVIADLTRDGGFPPLQLAPMDFVAMYQQHVMQNHKPA